MFSKQFKRALSTSSAIFDCPALKTHKCLSPNPRTFVRKEDLLKYYNQMVQIRKLELKLDIIYKQGLIRGFCHLYDGQEAVGVGIEAALKPSDHIITAYRCHAQQLLRGDSLRNIFSELIGREKGTSKGKGGSMHLYMPKNHFYGGNGIVGAQVPVGGGIAFASKFRGKKEVTAALFGDGAANQGQVFETANLAALWKLPLIFVVENNEYGMGTSTKRSSACSDFYTRGDYVPGIQCDGLDVIAVRNTMEHAAAHCREGKGPIFVEMKTYRYHGHSMSDPGKTYREREEVKDVRKNKDAILRCEKTLLEKGWASEKELKEMTAENGRKVEQALAEALEDKEPPLDERFADVYFEEEQPYVRGTDKEKSFRARV